MKKTLLLALLALTLTANLAFAHSIVPVLTNVTSLGGGIWQWQYAVTITTNSEIQASSGSSVGFQGLTVYDFAGYVPGSLAFDSSLAGCGTPLACATTSAQWANSVQNSGITPNGVTPLTGDNGGIPNLTWQYTAATTTCGGPPCGPGGPSFLNGATVLFYFTADSTSGPSNTTAGSFTAADHTNIGTVLHPNYQYEPNGSLVEVPGVPEPASMLLFGSGLAGLAGVIRKRLKK